MDITYERYLRWASTLVPHSKWWIDDEVFLQIAEAIFPHQSNIHVPSTWGPRGVMSIRFNTVQIWPKRARRR